MRIERLTMIKEVCTKELQRKRNRWWGCTATVFSHLAVELSVLRENRDSEKVNQPVCMAKDNSERSSQLIKQLCTEDGKKDLVLNRTWSHNLAIATEQQFTSWWSSSSVVRVSFRKLRHDEDYTKSHHEELNDFQRKIALHVSRFSLLLQLTSP